jgi:CHAD domain-containing protein
MTDETRELEQKYEGPPGTGLPALEGLPRVATVSGPELQTMRAEYYDTSDLRLLVSGVTLRRREGGSDEGWHLKLPEPSALANESGATSRRELRLPLQRRGDPVPEDLARLVRGRTRGRPLRPVAHIQTRRCRVTLRDEAGASLAEVVSDQVTAQTLGTSTTLSRWDEIEVELTGGSPGLLKAARKRLRQSGLRPASRSTKLERGLMTQLPPSPAGPELTRHSRAGQVILAYLSAQAARLTALDLQVRRGEPDSIHQMRVTIRRLRSTLRAFPMVIPIEATRHLSDELKWLGRVLGDARDSEVLSAHLLGKLASTPPELVMGPAQARIRAHFAPREAAARTAVAQTLNSARYFAMLEELDGLLDDPPLTAQADQPASEILPQAVARAFRRTRRRMRRAERAPAGIARDTALHETRKAAKRCRYAAEAALPASGKKARRLAKGMKRVQSALGDHHDAVAARAAAREIGVHAQLAGENAFTFGLLYESAHRDTSGHEDRARRAWKRAARHNLLP